MFADIAALQKENSDTTPVHWHCIKAIEFTADTTAIAVAASGEKQTNHSTVQPPNHTCAALHKDVPVHL